MARINQQLLERLENKLGLGRRRIYDLIDAKLRESHLPRPLAAIALASERGINISRFASAEQLAEIRQAARASAPSPVIVPETPPAKRTNRSRTVKKTVSRRSKAVATARRRGNSVFVVHGRDSDAR